jgi:hypothetical protein
MPNLKHNRRLGAVLVLITALAAIVAMAFVEPIPQEARLNHFVDQRGYLGIPNFWNIISNIPFLVIGILGLRRVLAAKNIQLLDELKAAYVIFYAAIALVAFGSSYYHISPDNSSLVWDRLPMTLAFMSLFAMVIGEFVSPKLGKALLWPLLGIGLYSVLYWHSVDDLRIYVLVQFLPLLLMPMLFFFFAASFTHVSGYGLLLLAYVAAKLLEHFDAQIFESLNFVSGHSLKHLAAAYGVYLLLKSFSARRPLR